MPLLQSESRPVREQSDIVQIRQEVRRRAIDLTFSLIDQTKIITAASELARNMLEYGGGGVVLFESISEGTRKGLRLTFEDQGPGIEDIERALTDGYTSGVGMGLGLGGSRRLVNEFEIESRVGQGTRVVIARWK
jgi:serine/threonine-protein kinase RsbT